MLTTTDGEQYQKAVFFLKLAEQKFETFLKKPYLKGVKIIPIVKHFKVFSEVNDVAKEKDADLIIMGSHGASGLKEFFVGSNTERVVRNANFDSVLFATDFEEESVAPYLRASRLFEKFGSKLTLLYVNLPNERFKSSIEIEIVEFLTAANGNLDKLNSVAYHADYTVEQGILNYANKIGADLIAIPTHGSKGVTHFFAGSIGEDIANHSELPVITFKI